MTHSLNTKDNNGSDGVQKAGISEGDNLFKYQGPNSSVSLYQDIAGLTET